MGELKKLIDNLSDEEIWSLFGYLNQVLRSRKLIRTRNIVGERGEFLAIETYNKTAGMPNLQAAPEGTQNVDALSRKGERYSIKTISLPSKTTGVFYGISDKDSEPEEKKFEYLIIVVIDKDFNLVKMFELSWKQFLSFKKWHSTMRAWNISITKALEKKAKLIIETQN